MTIIFHVANKATGLFLASVEPHLKEARAHFAGKLKEDKQTYQDITIESFVTPLREVSLHRAVFDDFIVYSNSPAGIRRVIDAHKGKVQVPGRVARLPVHAHRLSAWMIRSRTALCSCPIRSFATWSARPRASRNAAGSRP